MQEVWQALQRYAFDQAGPYPYSRRLAAENEWTHAYALQVVEEYRKFLLLLAENPRLIPSPAVELAWRLHLIFTESYWKGLCGRVIGKRIEHECEDGSCSSSVLRARYEQTLTSYSAVFSEEAPQAIWYEPDWKPAPLLHRARHWVTKRFSSTKMGRELFPVERIPAVHLGTWQKIKSFSFDRPGALYPYSRRLAEENGWDESYTQVVIAEYRKFIYLLAKSGHMVTPSLDVDEAWHLHLNNSRSYWLELCGKLLGNRLIHHHPGNGFEDGEKIFKAVYERTLSEYQEAFGDPPLRVWGKPNPDINWRVMLAAQTA